jgi:SAM-dependent methyltransferase
MSKLNKEINSFQQVWSGGYKTGYSKKRNQKGVEEYLKNNTSGEILLEIGCGGGQWSKFICENIKFEKLFCTDVLSAEHNDFWNYVGSKNKKNIIYKHVKDFDLDFIDDDSLDYVFSYDVFCHISYSGLNAYLESLYKKCKKGANILIMYADAEKYLKNEPENKNHVIKYLPTRKLSYRFSNKLLVMDAAKDLDGEPSDPNDEPRWYWVGINNFIELCEEKGFTVIEKDIDVDKTNPITLFQKK